MPSEPTDRLSIGQASAVTGLSVDTLRRFNNEGRLEAVRTPGGQRRFLRSDLDALMAEEVSS